jgi:hypothetical protein
VAKLKGPLLSEEAHKTLGGLLEFSKRNGQNLLRKHQQPTDKETVSQQTQRGYYQDAVDAWATLTDEQKQEWVDFNES